MSDRTGHCVAVFPLVARAETFATTITEPGWWATNVTRKGRTVEWDYTIPVNTEYQTTHREYLDDMLGSVGYFGSDECRKATLDGRKAPMSY